MLMKTLAMYEQFLTTVLEPIWETCKQSLRDWLGPEPLTYFLMENGHILPSSMKLSEEQKSEAYLYDPIAKRITAANNPTPEGRFRPLPYIGIYITKSNETTDITEWLGDVRANPVPTDMSVKQIILLWCYAKNRYIALEQCKIHVVRANGDEEDICIE
jgi:hypothetical protein